MTMEAEQTAHKGRGRPRKAPTSIQIIHTTEEPKEIRKSKQPKEITAHETIQKLSDLYEAVLAMKAELLSLYREISELGDELQPGFQYDTGSDSEEW